MWKPEHRLAADRRGLRYLSDLTDAEWAIVHPADIQDRDGAFHTYCARRDDYSRSSNAFLPTADTRDARWR
jgi:hypothetical protein